MAAGTLSEITTREDVEAFCAQFRAYVKQFDIAYSYVARQIGLSPSTISQFLSDEGYAGDAVKVAKRIQEWMDRDARKRSGPKQEGYVATAVAKRILTAIQFTAEEGGIGIVYGPAGVGKTVTARAYSEKINPSAIYVRVCEGATTARGLLRLLCGELRIEGSTWKVVALEGLRNKLGGSGRVILIDEAHRLEFDAMEVVRDLADMTECPVVLLGTAKIINRIDDGLRATRNWITDQFGSRVAIRQDLAQALGKSGGGDKLLFTVEEIRAIYRLDKVKLHSQAGRFLASLASTPGFGGLRIVSKVLRMVQRAFPGEPITVDLCRAAYRKITSDGRTPPEVQGVEQTPEANVA